MRKSHRYTWRRFRLSLGAAAFCAVAGFVVRHAEDGQVGYTHDVSTWIFAAAGILAYYAAIVAFVIARGISRGERPPKRGYWD